MDVRIRDARPEDVDALVGLLAELFSIEADFVVDETRQRRGVQLMLDGGGTQRSVRVAEAAGRVVGMCTAQLLISTAEGGLAAQVEDLVVAAPCRGKGVGRRLMASIEDWACGLGVTRLQLLADRTNTAGVGFYDRIGWQPTRLICLWKREPCRK
jgi:ribosomal protein S18 acetylase RimI-like enzyme